MRLLPILLLLTPLFTACVVRSSNNNNNNNNNPPPNNVQPLTVVVDTDQTMIDTNGGEGVGVFVEYATGGHWHVRWTCDTNKSGLPCDFTVTLSGANISHAVPTAFESNDHLDSSSNNQLVATTHTSTGVDAVDFDATPGSTTTVDVAVSGLRDGAFFFWVGDDGSGNPAINGGYTGQLTDPLVFEPSSP